MASVAVAFRLTRNAMSTTGIGAQAKDGAHYTEQNTR
jgi:hypothetical protein